MSRLEFGRAVAAGFFGSYAMAVAGAWQVAIGLHPHDPAALMARTLDPLGGGRGWAWGLFYHYMNGIVLALIYARFINRRVALHPLILANLYGLALAVLATVVGPRLSPHAIGTGHPVNRVLGRIMAHAAYATTLALFYLSEPNRLGDAGIGGRKAGLEDD